ncbi:MAG: 1-(5-phosphoribosyl)-5-[(5-phosphoribosylamino)methylideneamino] imidazole-4-carboxamide isomerase [Hyphomonadaceae bacterium]|nr:1-(5-phosphoribosyl)-5-[(5-phosphoribosylamino)methylideneamino] imidazole-4-carboxamide isomerase [Hyphomonadaceae bacterium]
MLIVPAIDLSGGACVRLFQGRFDAVTDYGDPFVRLRAFERAGAEWVHIVDLDGARQGAPAQSDLIARLAAETNLKIQCGGGARSRLHAQALLDAGVSRVVVGSVAVRDPGAVCGWIDAFGVDRICLALDVRARGDAWEVAADGWTAGGGKTLSDVLQCYPHQSLHVLVTDISRDGALTGPNLTLMRTVRALRPDIRLQASGGVSSLVDLAALRDAGADAAIVGRALYENRFTLEAALAL